MPRGMDDTFHRLLWITLVVVAFTFTVILTSVFVDIDDLLAKRNSPVMKQETVTEVLRAELPAEFVGDFQGFSSNEEDSDENESTFRTKRSLESNNYFLHIKNPKIKKALSKRLTALLEELDEEEPSKTIEAKGVVVDSKDKNIVNSNDLSPKETVQNKESILNIKDTNFDKLRNEIDHKDILHLAMHNILLQGIIGHLDLNEVYNKIHMLIKSFETKINSDVKEMYVPKFNESKTTELIKIIAKDSFNEEEKFFNELIKCEKLQEQILQSQNFKGSDKKGTAKDSHMIIKTIIEITNNNRDKENLKSSNENITGAVRLVYNGNEIKSVDMIDDKNTETDLVKKIHTKENQQNMELSTKKIDTEWQNDKESELDQAIAEYLKTHSIKFHNKYVMTKGSYVSKRLKRQIKIRYLDQVTTQKPKRLKGKPNHDDELYVEIETHFDGKGTKGEKKKKLVRTLIDKIQKAINSNVEVLDQDKTMQQKHLQVKKRIQNPIDRNELNVNTISPIDTIEHRQLNPISKTINTIQPLTNVLDKSGNTWKKIYNGPSFLAVSKAVNSAEMNELDIDYNSVMKNGIPKRLQKPINTENEDLIKSNEYTDMGNVTLFLKDINGSGFSIGINQYMDEPPDKETLKMFTGLENLIQAYHEQYDQTRAVSIESEEQAHNFVDTNHEIKRRDVNKQTELNNIRLVINRFVGKEMDRNKFYEFARSSRHKRHAINVKLFSNIKSKTKLNKYINTNAKPTKKIFLKNKRNKRQIDKIRLLASDHYPPTSSEDIFLVSRENIYADRAIVKEDEIPEVEIGDRNDEHFDFIAPYSYNMNVPNLQPAYLTSNYNTKSLHSELMSKYPHIFLENISRSKDLINISPSNMLEQEKINKENIETVNDNISNEKNISSTNVDEIVNAILPSRNNFKVVVKIFPKNKTNLGPSYKEVHTLINKSYDKNGVRYVSSLNVSEVSKFESLNKTKEEIIPTTTVDSETERQQNQIKLLLKLHKERIDQQLEHLKIESQKVKQMIGHENLNTNMSHLIDVFRQLGLKSSHDRHYFRINDHYPNINITTSITNTIISEFETTMNPLLTTIYKEDSDKIKILNSIKENKNITREILEKIDKNTNILQSFLQKLVNQRQSTPQTVNAEKALTNDTPTYVTDNQVIRPFVEQLHTNVTNTIPFIYAFQHPLTKDKDNTFKTVANVIYHGHIHANKAENDGEKNNFFKSVTNNLKIENNKTKNSNRQTNGNETRFFIDELENDFKLVSNFNDRSPIESSVKTNSTKYGI